VKNQFAERTTGRLQSAVEALQKKPALNWLYIVIAVDIGLVIDYLLKGH